MNEFALRHLRVGWWSLLLFLTLGIVLEALHGFKSGYYLDVGNDARRLMWTLAHAHGTLLALIHIAFAVSLSSLELTDRALRLASSCLVAASILLPGGFFLGGIVIYGGDPGVGVFLVPPGGLVLLVGVLAVARGVGRRAA